MSFLICVLCFKVRHFFVLQTERPENSFSKLWTSSSTTFSKVSGSTSPSLIFSNFQSFRIGIPCTKKPQFEMSSHFNTIPIYILTICKDCGKNPSTPFFLATCPSNILFSTHKGTQCLRVCACAGSHAKTVEKLETQFPLNTPDPSATLLLHTTDMIINYMEYNRIITLVRSWILIPILKNVRSR
jgi:hypothetical protein